MVELYRVSIANLHLVDVVNQLHHHQTLDQDSMGSAPPLVPNGKGVYPGHSR